MVVGKAMGRERSGGDTEMGQNEICEHGCSGRIVGEDGFWLELGEKIGSGVSVEVAV